MDMSFGDTRGRFRRTSSIKTLCFAIVFDSASASVNIKMGAFLSRSAQHSTYAACADMREVVAEDKWQDLLTRPGDLRVVDVNLGKVPYDDRVLGFRFKLEYCGEQPRGCSVLLLFPNLNDVTRQVPKVTFVVCSRSANKQQRFWIPSTTNPPMQRSTRKSMHG